MDSANKRTQTENQKIIEKDEELKNMKEKMNEEIIANEHNKNIINGLKEEVKKLKESPKFITFE